MTDIACNICRECNHKGRPSVSRGSAYCDAHYHRQTSQQGFFARLKERIQTYIESRWLFKEKLADRFTEKRKVMKKGKDGTLHEEEVTEMKKIKGFRDDYIYR